MFLFFKGSQPQNIVFSSNFYLLLFSNSKQFYLLILLGCFNFILKEYKIIYIDGTPDNIKKDDF